MYAKREEDIEGQMKNLRAVCYSNSMTSQSPMAYVRLIAPFNQAGMEIINGYHNSYLTVETLHNADFVLFHREIDIQHDDYIKVVELARKERKPIVLDLDDLLFFIPQDHPDRLYYDSLLTPTLQALKDSDLITVSTSKLRDVLVNFHKNVVVLPNYFDDHLWVLKPPMIRDSASDVLTIGYMGTKSHKPDLEYLIPVLLEIIEQYPQKVCFLFWGVQPPDELISLPQVKWISRYLTPYKDFASFFQTQSADIFIGPLVDNLFNRCKSPIKFFEYSSLGAPGIYSRLEPYEEVVTHGKNGLLASSLDEWKDSLIQLIEDNELRHRLATNAQASIKQKYLLSKNAFRWADTYKSISETVKKHDKGDPKESHTRTILLQILETAIALSEQAADKDHAIQTLTTQLSQAEIEIEQLRAEVLKYALSKSWRITRPFRKLMGKLER